MRFRKGSADQDILIWVLVGVGVVALGAVLFFMFFSGPKERYLEIDGVRIWKLPDNAEDVNYDISKAASVKSMVQKGNFIAFEGYAIGAGTPQDKEIAKIRAYQNVAEFLNTRVQTFAQLVEGQLQNVQISGNKQNIVSASVNAYKRVTELLADARISGAYVFASWKVRKGNVVETYVLLVYDPGMILKIIEMDAQVKQTIDELGKQGINFFENLNAVLKEATKGTPMERK
ncbi:hypothetical protein [Fervidobacterium thailandense]|uniref:Uncharacterized protein n=1 Tax=Fervidobacterium thailandense TaxID=1008305 RepID=A0A1E3G515_9BACT|nr:hypothetical protein [Fervidobacterium thailandense]ODN31381.1 hypothetical protein A4H02_01065 [Fervidobacterium thailandense]